MVDRMLSFNSESPQPNKREEKEELKKEQEMIKSAKDQWEAIKNDPKKLFPQSTSASILKAQYKPDWIERVDFELCDAAKYMEKYAFADGKDFTHIYSYNKVMSKNDCKGISEILNRTNFRILAWYFNPDKTTQTGLKHVELIH